MSERDSYLYLQCEQCGVTRMFYSEQYTLDEQARQEEIWTLKHYGHEAKVGITAFKQAADTKS